MKKQPTAMEIAIKNAVAELGMLRYFPVDAAVQAGVMALLERMATTPEQVDWLVRAMIDQVGEWQGPTELRGVFCTKYSPKDGIEVDCARGGRFGPDVLEMRYLAEHEETKQLGAGASRELLPLLAIEGKIKALPAEAPPGDGPRPAVKREPVTEMSEKKINDLLKAMGAA